MDKLRSSQPKEKDLIKKKEEETQTQEQPRSHKIDQAVKGTTSNPREPKAGEQCGGEALLVSPYTHRRDQPKHLL